MGIFSNLLIASFTKTASRSCYQNDYGRYDTLDEAKLACSNDSECSGIYDVFCNGPPFVLCPMKEDLKYSKSSCTYIKGMLFHFIQIYNVNYAVPSINYK